MDDPCPPDAAGSHARSGPRISGRSHSFPCSLKKGPRMPQYLETTADKFTFRVATDRLYTPEGIWILEEPGTQRVRIGLADYIQQRNGDVAFANVKPAGTKLSAGGQFGEIET